jgi:2-oxo-4-hydroxy-4-carboxy-5-ureidoimidazoline decarboxylase
MGLKNMRQILLSELNELDRDAFISTLGNIVEYSPWIADCVMSDRPFAGVKQLLDAIASVITDLSYDKQLALIKVHPDLADKTQRAAGLTPESNAEQNSAGLDRLSEAESIAFERLNEAYRGKFGFPYIVCARRYTKESILQDFERRLLNDAASEARRAIDEIIRIVALRLDQLVLCEDRLKVHGRLSTHVLDTHAGRPAPGVPIELFELAANGKSRIMSRAITNDEGRTNEPLIGGRPLPIGRYELRFRVGPYFESRGVPISDPPFLDLIPLQFAISEPESHYHVPLLITPWSYSTYRGS